MSEANPLFFPTPAAWRTWLSGQHDQLQELWVGFYKKGSGKPSITWPEAVDQALCFGWIDGIRKSIDEDSYMIRFTPRKPHSTWSTVNMNRVMELTQLGLMQPVGLKAFEARKEDRSGIYAYEQRHEAALDESAMQEFRANNAAWKFFQAQAPSYQKTAIWWVVSAKRDETKRKRLATLIDDSAHGRKIAPLTRSSKSD